MRATFLTVIVAMSGCITGDKITQGKGCQTTASCAAGLFCKSGTCQVATCSGCGGSTPYCNTQTGVCTAAPNSSSSCVELNASKPTLLASGACGCDATSTCPSGTACDASARTCSVPVSITSLTASLAHVILGESVTIAWAAANTTSCTLSDGTTTLAATTSGTIQLTPLAAVALTLTCQGGGGPLQQKLNVPFSPALFVDCSKSSSGDGSSWESAFATVGEAIGAASGQALEIWAKASDCYASDTQPVATMTPGLIVRGGYTGTTGVDAARGSPRTILHGKTADGSQLAIHTVIMDDNTTLDQVEITDGTLSGAGAGSQGAGIYALGKNNATLVNVKVTGNTINAPASTVAWGAGIYVDGGSLTLDTCDVSANHTNGNGISKAYGGGIAATNGATLTLVNTKVNNNVVLGGTNNSIQPGGAVYGGGLALDGPPSSQGHLSISGNSQIDGNHALGGLGAIGGGSGGPAAGGGLHATAWVITISNSEMKNNQAVGGAGGAGFWDFPSCTGTFIVGGNGGAAHGGAFVLSANAPATLTTVAVDGNLARGGDGGIGAIGDSNCPDGGNAGAGGLAFGGAADVGSILAATGGSFSSNTAKGGNGAAGGSGGAGSTGGNGGAGGNAVGGAIEVEFGAGVLTLTTVTLAGNAATGGDGGALGLAQTNGTGGNSGGAAGGAIHAENDANIVLKLVTCTGSGNSATEGTTAGAGHGTVNPAAIVCSASSQLCTDTLPFSQNLCNQVILSACSH